MNLTLEAKFKYQEDGSGPFRRLVWWGNEAPLAAKGFCLGINGQGQLQFEAMNPTAMGPTLRSVLPGVGGVGLNTGGAKDVVSNGNYAYVAAGGFGISVVDISIPSAPVVVGSAIPPFTGGAIALAGSLLYVTGSRIYHSSSGAPQYTAGFYIYDISNAEKPVLKGKLETATFGFAGLALSGNYAYVACGGAGIRVIGISNPLAPALVGPFYDTPGFPTRLTVSGNYLYVADGASGLRIYDITNPLALVLVPPGLNTAGSAKGVAYFGGYVYIADNNWLRIIDVSNVTAPTQVGEYSAFGFAALDVKVHNGYAYVPGAEVLNIVNVSNPGAPGPVYNLPPAGVPASVTIGVFPSGTTAYVCNGVGGLAVADITTPENPSNTGHIAAWFEGKKVAAKPGLAVIVGDYYTGYAVGTHALWTINTTDPAAPVVVGKLEDPLLNFQGLALSGNYAYVATGNDGLKVVDISNPAQPTIVGEYDTPGYANAVAVSGDYAYVADGSQGLRIVNISNPLWPVSAGSLDTPGSAFHVTVAGGFAYVADNNSVKIIDISDPTDPRFVTGGSIPVPAFEVQVQNGLAYVASGSSGLRIWDVSDPGAPSARGIFAVSPWETSATTLGVTVAGNLAYLANGVGGLVIVNISDPMEPTYHASLLTIGSATGVVLDGDWIYLADTLGGFSTVWNGPGSNVRSQAVLQPNTWYRAGLTYDGTNAKMYLDGVGVTTAPVTAPFSWNAPQLRFGQWAGGTPAVAFDNPEGVGDEFVTVPNSASLNITGTAITVEAWVKKTPQEIAYEQTLVGRLGAWRLELYSEEGTEGGYNIFRFVIETTAGTFATNSFFRLRSNQAYHVAGVYDGAFIRLYVNGAEVLDPVEASGTLLDVAAPVLFGAKDTNPAVNPLFGQIAEVRIWNVARTQAQIQTSMASVAAPQAGLAGIWRLEEGVGVIANDASGNANHGTLTNGPLWTTFSLDSVANVSMAELRAWTTVRTPAEIAANLDSVTPPQAGLLALYEFDETTGSEAADSSGNAHTATINGAFAWESEDYSAAAAYAGILEVNLAWAPIAEAESYNVKRAASSGGSFTLIGNTLEPRYRDANVMAGTDYFYKVFGVKQGVEGAGSAEMMATPTAAPPEKAAPKAAVVLKEQG